MRLASNSLYKKDLDIALEHIDLDFLDKKKVFITGGTGLIGSAIVDLLLRNNKTKRTRIQLYIASRNKEKVMERFGEDDCISWVEYDALKSLQFNEPVDYIIHCAGNASPELYVSQAVETMLTNILGLENLLKYALHQPNCKLIYLSSSEVYGQKDIEESFKEDSFGYIDILSDRASYASSKRASETLCKAYSLEYGLNTCIVRPGHIFGPTASVSDGRVSSAFAYKAAQGMDLFLKSSGGQIRSYMYCLDCASAILLVLKKGSSGQAYNICGEEITSIRQLSEYFAKAGKVKLDYQQPTIDELHTFNPMNNSSLDCQKIYSLGFQSIFSVEEAVFHTVKILKDTVENVENI